jgi:hypothetical protein
MPDDAPEADPAPVDVADASEACPAPGAGLPDASATATTMMASTAVAAAATRRVSLEGRRLNR